MTAPSFAAPAVVGLGLVIPLSHAPATVLVELSDWMGEQLAAVDDPDEFVLGVILESADDSTLLRYVKSNGYLVLNDVQMPDFLTDWQAVERFVISPADRRAWEEVVGLAERCRHEPLTFLRFVGD